MGLLDYISNIKFEPNPVGMGLLGMGAQMMNASTNQNAPIGFGNIAGGALNGFNQGLQGYIEQQKLNQDEELKKAQAQYYLAHARSYDSGGPDAKLLNSVKTFVRPDGSLEYIRIRKDGTIEKTGYSAPMSLENGMVSVQRPGGGYEIQNAPGVESSKFGQSAANQAGKEFETVVERDVIGPDGKVITGVRSRQGDIVPNNNFGNIKKSDLSGFNSYDTPEDGWNAIDNQLLRYGNNGVNTLEGIISKWSPATENNTSQLIANASKYLGLDPKQPIDLTNPIARRSIIPAIIRQEYGNQGLYGNGVPAGAKKSAEEQVTTDALNERNQNESIVKARDALPAARDNTLAVLNTSDKLLTHPALNDVVGKPDWYQKNAFLNGSPQADFVNIFNQLNGQGFISAFQSLKGAGAITDREGEAATKAISRMSTATSKAEFLSAVNDFRSVIKTGLNRAYDLAQGKQYDPDALKKPDWLNNHTPTNGSAPEKVKTWNPVTRRAE